MEITQDNRGDKKDSALVLVFGRHMGTVYRLFNGKLLKQNHINTRLLRRASDRVYLFAPAETMEEIKTKMPAWLTSKLRLEIIGNFLNSSPSILLRKLKELQSFKTEMKALDRTESENNSPLVHQKFVI